MPRDRRPRKRQEKWRFFGEMGKYSTFQLKSLRTQNRRQLEHFTSQPKTNKKAPQFGAWSFIESHLSRLNPKANQWGNKRERTGAI